MTDKTETPKTDHEHVLTLVQSLYNRAYADKPDAVPFEPSDTLAGLIDQLDNMLVGVLDEREELTKENKQLRKNQLDLFDSLDTSSHELASLIEHVNNELSNNISSADTEPPEYLDAETPYKAYHLLMDILPFISTHGEDTNSLWSVCIHVVQCLILNYSQPQRQFMTLKCISAAQRRRSTLLTSGGSKFVRMTKCT